MTAEDTQEGNGKMGVAYTVKELLSNLNDKMDRIEAKIDKKVDRSELDVFISRLVVIEAKQSTAEALKIQSDQIAQVYLKQWEAMQDDIVELKAYRQTAEAINKNKDNWKVLWIPVIVNSVAVAILVYEAFIK